MSIKLSVIVPVYNVEKYIHKCMDSIIHQTYKNLEIILVDDGSTDNSGSICDYYAHTDTRIKVIHDCNHGLSHARNKGIEASNGDWITFVDSDDWIDLEMYEHMCTIAGQYDVDIVIASHTDVDDAMADETAGTGKILLFNQQELLEEYIIGERKLYITPSVWDRIYRREVVGSIRFKEGMIYEDVPYTMSVFCKCRACAYIDRSFYKYRVKREGRIMEMNFGIRNWNDLLRMNNDAIACLEHYGYHNYAEMESISLYNKISMLSRNSADKEIKNEVKKYRKEHRAEALKKIFCNQMPGSRRVLYIAGVLSPQIQNVLIKVVGLANHFGRKSKA